MTQLTGKQIIDNMVETKTFSHYIPQNNKLEYDFAK
jgi:hypothetical protein